MYTKESISSLLNIYTGRVSYTKTCGSEREYMLKSHPLQSTEHKKVFKPEHPDKVVLWCVGNNKWRYLRPEGVTHIQTEF